MSRSLRFVRFMIPAVTLGLALLRILARRDGP
jgi:hypothetical protein